VPDFVAFFFASGCPFFFSAGFLRSRFSLYFLVIALLLFFLGRFLGFFLRRHGFLLEELKRTRPEEARAIQPADLRPPNRIHCRFASGGRRTGCAFPPVPAGCCRIDE
jgi:hypothetical protein